MACHDLQVMEEVLDALADSVQKQQRAKDEVQQRFNEEAGQPGCQKQRKKDLTDRLQVEDAKLQKKQQNLREAQSVQESWQGVRPLQSINIACMGDRHKHSTVPCAAWYAGGHSRESCTAASCGH